MADFREQGATIFPMPLGLAATFDQRLMEEVASIMGDEARAKANAAYQTNGELMTTNCFDPNINIYRDPRWGRGAETFGEDPYLTTRMVVAYVRGLQWGVSDSSSGELRAAVPRNLRAGAAGSPRGFLKAGATCKHFAAYSLEEFEGTTRMGFDARVDPRDLQDTYLPAFEACAREGVGSIMCAYNAINGTPSCANEWLLQRTLREGWQFSGFVVSDCGAIEALADQHAFAGSLAEGAAAALKAGTDLGCLRYSPYLADALTQGLVTQDVVDRAVQRLLVARLRQGHFDHDPAVNRWAAIPETVVGQPSHLSKARQAAAKSIVLLKNAPLPPGLGQGQADPGAGAGGLALAASAADGAGAGAVTPALALPTLPLRLAGVRSVTVVGPMANQSELLLGNYYGNPFGELLSPWGALERRVAAWNAALGAGGGGAVPVALNLLPGADVTGGGADVDAAVSACRLSDVCIFFLGTSMISTDRTRKSRAGAYDVIAPATEGEAWDRHDLLLPGEQLSLVQGAAKRTNATIVVVLVHGGPLDVSWMQESDRVGAILTAWYPGQGAEAIADVLLGDISPSGRLPVSFPYNNYTQQISLAEMRMRPWPGRTHRFLQVPVLYPFGHGLSYAVFGYMLSLGPGPSMLRYARSAAWVEVTVNVTHQGGMAAEDAVLLFLSRQQPQQAGEGAGGTPPAALNLTAACRQLPAEQDGRWEGEPQQNLVGFNRVYLAAGQSGVVSFHIIAGSLAAFASGGGRQPHCGRYWLRVGAVSAAVDISPPGASPPGDPSPSPAALSGAAPPAASPPPSA